MMTTNGDELITLNGRNLGPANSLDNYVTAVYGNAVFEYEVVCNVSVEHISIQCAKPTPFQIGGDVIGSRDSVEARLSKRDIHVVDYYAPPPV